MQLSIYGCSSLATMLTFRKYEPGRTLRIMDSSVSFGWIYTAVAPPEHTRFTGNFIALRFCLHFFIYSVLYSESGLHLKLWNYFEVTSISLCLTTAEWTISTRHCMNVCSGPSVQGRLPTLTSLTIVWRLYSSNNCYCWELMEGLRFVQAAVSTIINTSCPFFSFPVWCC